MLCEPQIISRQPAYQLTDEQVNIVHAVATKRNILVSALAGTGKTSTLVSIAQEYPDRKALYLAYNKNLQLEARQKFPSHVACKTIHGLAYQDMGIPYATQLTKKLHIDTIVDHLSIHPIKFEGFFASQGLIAAHAHEITKIFSYSLDKTVQSYHYSKRFLDRLTDKYGPLPFNLKNMEKPKTFLEHFIAQSCYHAQRLWQSMIDHHNEHIPANHDTYLKLYQLKKPLIQGYDYIMLDEAQDANPVILDILSHQSVQRIYVGDANQQIYGFRGTVNAMETIEADKYYLTQSFRFGPAIAEEANKVLKKLKVNNLLKGFEPIQSKIAPVDQSLPYTFIARTNAELFKAIVAKQSANVKIHFVGDINKVMELFESAYFLKNNKLSLMRDSSLKRFSSWDKFTDQADLSGDHEYLAIINFIQDYKDVPKILKVIKGLCSYTEEEADIIMTTAHKAKGRQWSQVHVHNDFQADTSEEKNIYYVAITRAIHIMDNGVYG